MYSARPNFFLIGAPKAGTTALGEYLRTHPNVLFSDPKEPDYFNFDFANRFVKAEKDYLRLFAEARPEHIAIGEGSTRYFESMVAISEILKFNPESKFIVSLRNPIEMAPALHSQYVYEGYEDELDFAVAWRLQDERKIGNCIPKICIEPKMVLYREACALGQHLHRLFETLSQDQLKVLFFEDLSANPRKTYLDVLEFLGIPDDCRTTFPVVNSNKGYRSSTLQSWIYKLGGVKRQLGIKRPLGLHGFIMRWNVKERQRRRLEPELKMDLVSYFHDEIRKVERLTKRDLSHWLR